MVAELPLVTAQLLGQALGRKLERGIGVACFRFGSEADVVSYVDRKIGAKEMRFARKYRRGVDDAIEILLRKRGESGFSVSAQGFAYVELLSGDGYGHEMFET
jgi:hypothetical protein